KFKNNIGKQDDSGLSAYGLSMKALSKAVAGRDMEVLEKALKDAEAAGAGADLLEKARDRLCELKEAEARAKAAEELQAAIDSGDLALLEAALAKARSLKVPEDVLRAAEAVMYAACAQASLFRAMEGHDIQVLENALKDAEAAGVGSDVLEKARDRLCKLKEAEARAKAAEELQ
ncbi:unnamed protein product, partial [Symbiodinium pilosum]